MQRQDILYLKAALHAKRNPPITGPMDKFVQRSASGVPSGSDGTPGLQSLVLEPAGFSLPFVKGQALGNLYVARGSERLRLQVSLLHVCIGQLHVSSISCSLLIPLFILGRMIWRPL